VRLAGSALPPEWRAPLVLRVKSDADRYGEAQREAAIQDWIADLGYPAPRVLAVLAPGELSTQPAQVMERAPGTVMLQALLRRPWQALRRARQLAALHVRLHRLPAEGFVVKDDLLDRRLALVREVAGGVDDVPLSAGLAAVDGLADRLRAAPPSICHGDFHPLNVVVNGDEASVIDWTDAGVGDRHGDIARTALLFELAAVAASNAAERLALRAAGPRLRRAYMRAYAKELTLDAQRVELWEPVHLLHGWAQVVALHAGLFGRDGPDDRPDRVPPGMAAELHRRFDRALARVL
jgi:aminoglycoside phosphotransferase (APT) family kinase protein